MNDERHDHHPPIPVGRWLDPRHPDAVRNAPLAGGVNIPLPQIGDRLHELPPPDRTIRVAAESPLMEMTLSRLAAHRRKAAGFPLTAARRSAHPARYRLWEPSATLAAWLDDLPRGRCVDLGCGSGRDVVFLASAGWEATGIDWLPDALARGRDLATRYLAEPGRTTWQTLDLEADEVAPPGRFDLVTGFRFLHRPLLRRLAAWLRPGGCVLWETFTTEHRARHGKPQRDAFVLEADELPDLLAGFEVLRFDEGWRGEVHTARVLARRTGD